MLVHLHAERKGTGLYKLAHLHRKGATVGLYIPYVMSQSGTISPQEPYVVAAKVFTATDDQRHLAGGCHVNPMQVAFEKFEISKITWK